MSSYYPYGPAPSTGYAPQPGVQVNPIGYSSPVVSPFHQIIANHGLSKMISGISGSSSYSSDPDVAVVTYDSFMDDKEFTINRLGLNSSDVKEHGKPLGLKFKDCGVVIPLPSKKSVCSAIDRQINTVTGNKTLSDKEKKALLKDISEKLAIEFFTAQCNPKNPFNAKSCGFPADTADTGYIGGVNAVIRAKYP